MTTIATLLIAAAVAVACYAARARMRGRAGRRPKAPSQQRGVDETVRTARFSAVEIRTALDSCAAAQALVGEVLLASQAPVLPLKGCDRPCRCAFTKLADRRQETRRWSGEGIAALFYSARERRSRGDRRRS